jgi:hypothetical protein
MNYTRGYKTLFMKTFVLTVSRTFPKAHKRAGQQTHFIEKIACGLFCPGDCSDCSFKNPKIHTIRSNFELWSKRIEQTKKGEAIISLRYWSGKPYNSKQIEIFKLNKYSGLGIQKLFFERKHNELGFTQENVNGAYWLPKGKVGDEPFSVFPDIKTIAINDGLDESSFREWFDKYDLSKPMAIIHFTEMRY